MMKSLNFPQILPQEKKTFARDLLVQILVHLPLKALFRFKLVCKQWNSIISDPRVQLMHNNNRAVGLFFQTNFHSWNICLPPPLPVFETRLLSFNNDMSRSSSNPLPKTLRILHSCNGLLVLEMYNTDHVFAKPEYYVYNPTTKQITTNLLKDDVIEARLEWDRVVGMYLAFDPSKSPHYKVVCVLALQVFEFDYEFEFEFAVFSSETRSWEIRGGRYNTNTSGYVNFQNKGVFWNGAIHWAGYSDRKSVYFNPDLDDQPRVMPTPPIHQQWSYFGESCSHLHCANLVGDDDLACRRGIYVYEMSRDYSEWFLKFRVVDDDDYSHLFLPKIQNLFCVVRGGNKDSDSFLVLGTDVGEIIRYDLVRKPCETIAKDAFFSSGNMPNSFQYIESPCSV